MEGMAVKILTDCLTSFPVLALPDFNKPFSLATDARDAADEIIFSHQAKGPGKRRISAYLHRFTPREQRYVVREEL